jgi:probable phosphoglycerate mutase
MCTISQASSTISASKQIFLYLVRHGETEWSRTGQHTGHSDIPLTDGGRKQAKVLKSILSKTTFSAVFTSPLQRAYKTCQAAGYNGIEDPLLKEWDYGRYEGKTSDEILIQQPHWNLFEHGAPGGENLTDVAKRAREFLAKLQSRQGPILIFSSGHILRVIAACWIEQNPILSQSLSLFPASISILGWERTTKSIIRWNDISHLA